MRRSRTDRCPQPHPTPHAHPTTRHVDYMREPPLLPVQAAILLLFNEAEQLNFTDIQVALKLEETELRRTLASLSLAKER